MCLCIVRCPIILKEKSFSHNHLKLEVLAIPEISCDPLLLLSLPPVFVGDLLHDVLAAQVVRVGADLDAHLVLGAVGAHLNDHLLDALVVVGS